MSDLARFDEAIHAPLRLRICGLLRRVDQLDFAVLRDTLEVSDAAARGGGLAADHVAQMSVSPRSGLLALSNDPN